MKKSSVALMAAALILSSCGTLTRLADSSEGQKFQDGIYASTPDLKSREEKVQGKAETEELIAKTKESPIYLFGDKKDTIMLPESHSATIRYDRNLSSTVVTVTENPYDWRNNLNPWSYYTPYSIGSSWYWSRHWSPFWSMSPYTYSYMYGGPWFYGWNDPWYYGGYWGRWYDPFDYWGFWGWNSPWYYTGYWGGYPWYPHYAGWYGGFYPHWTYPHYGHGGPGLGSGGHFSSKIWYGPRHETQTDSRVFTDNGRTTVRRGVGSSSSTGRGTLGGSSTSRSSVTASKSSGGNSAVRRTVARQNAAVASGNADAASKPSASSNGNVTYRRPAVSSRSTSEGSSAAVRSVSGSNSQSRGTVGSQSTVSRSSSAYERNSSSYERSSSSTSTRSSSYSSGGGSGASRSSAGGGGGASRSGGSAGGGRR